MSNALFEVHSALGEPCGENAGLDEITDWAGSVLLKSLSGAWYHWRPIESAPQDGTPILVYADDAMYVVRWSDPDCPDVDFDDPHGAKSECAWWHVDDNKHGPYALRGPSPTHWMPLPPAPENA